MFLFSEKFKLSEPLLPIFDTLLEFHSVVQNYLILRFVSSVCSELKTDLVLQAIMHLALTRRCQII